MLAIYFLFSGYRSLDTQIAFPGAFHRSALIAADRRENAPKPIDETPWNAIRGSVADRAGLTIGGNAQSKTGSTVHGWSISIKSRPANEQSAGIIV
jgi:hypothetical protein